MEEDGTPLALFHDVVFSIIPSEGLSVAKTDSLMRLLTDNGAEFQSLSHPDERLKNLETLTHVISEHIEFPQYNTALEHGVFVVKPSWVIASAGKGKQATMRQYNPDPNQYFQDVVLTCGNLPRGDKDAIVAGVIALGGQYSGPLSKLVTHIVTIDDNDEKSCLAVERALNCNIVLPHWFDDCLRLGKIISEKPYRFPDPEILRTDNSQIRIQHAESSHLDGAAVACPTGAPPETLSFESTISSSPTAVRKNLNAFMSKKIFISYDLELSTHIHDTIKGLINHGGATLTDEIDDCDIYIGQYRDGSDYVKASRAGKEVANLSWLYHVINRNKYTNPLSKLLHYPVPREPLPGFEGMRISVSNYTGDARIYLENLVRHCGAEFTKTMKQDNTHLITAHTQSEKCEAAQEWGINIINHIWLEECYAKCTVLTLTNPRYSCFPARTNLSEVTGQTTSFDMKRVEQAFFPKPREIVKSSPQKPVPNTSSGLGETAVTAPENDEPLTAEPRTAKKARGRPRKSSGTPRFLDDEKENESPLMHSSGRASKTKALGMLHEQADDIALYQKEMKRKGGVTHGRRSFADELSSPIPVEPKQRKKRTSDEATYDVTAEGSDLSDGETQAAQPVKKTKTKHALAPGILPPVRYRMMVTGDDRWMGKANKESADRLQLRQLGIVLVQDPERVDILVAPRLLRTRKFVCALASAPQVVHSDYLTTTLEVNELQDPSPLEDRETEGRLGINLADALARAKVNKGKLLGGWSILVTKDVSGGFATFQDIIKLNGGVGMLYAGRLGLTLPKRIRPESPNQGSDDENDGMTDDSDEEYKYVYLVSGNSEPEVKLWKTFRNLADNQGMKARIVSTDWLLNAAMDQRVVWKDQYALDEESVMSRRDG